MWEYTEHSDGSLEFKLTLTKHQREEMHPRTWHWIKLAMNVIKDAFYDDLYGWEGKP